MGGGTETWLELEAERWWHRGTMQWEDGDDEDGGTASLAQHQALTPPTHRLRSCLIDAPALLLCQHLPTLTSATTLSPHRGNRPPELLLVAGHSLPTPAEPRSLPCQLVCPSSTRRQSRPLQQ